MWCETYILGDKGIGSSTDGWTGHQAQSHMAQCLREVDTSDSIKGGSQGLHISLLGAWLPCALVQDVPTVQNEEECVDTAGLGCTLCQATL